MDLEDRYPTQKIQNSGEKELADMLKQFKSKEVSLLKFGGFLAYNALALVGLMGFAGWYIRKNRPRKGEKPRLKKSELTLFNIVKKGSKIGVMLGGMFITGFLIVGHYTMPINVFKKYCQLQYALYSFTFRFDPLYQEMLLFRRMKKFGLPDSLIQEVKDDLNETKERLIQSGKITEQTIQEIRKSQQVYKADQMS